MRWMVIAVLLVGLFVACGGNSETAETPDPITSTTEVSDDSDAELVRDVEAEIAAAVDATLEAVEAISTPTPMDTATAEPTATSTEVPATRTPQPTNTPRPQPTATQPPTFAVGPGGGPQYQDGLYVTIHTIEDPVVSSNQFLQPDAGNRFLSLDTEICAGNEQASGNPYNFQLQMPDNTRRNPGVGIREPSLNATQLAPGDCVRGWTTFQVEEGQTPAFIIYETAGYKPAKFVWP